MKKRILIADMINAKGLELLQADSALDVVVETGLDEQTLCSRMADCAAVRRPSIKAEPSSAKLWAITTAPMRFGTGSASSTTAAVNAPSTTAVQRIVNATPVICSASRLVTSHAV